MESPKVLRAVKLSSNEIGRECVKDDIRESLGVRLFNYRYLDGSKDFGFYPEVGIH
jgi:hypothetical protein